MATKRGKEKDPKIQYKQLALAEKWAKQLGNKVERGEATLVTGKKVPLLNITHGNKPIFVHEANEIITVWINIGIPEEVREKIKTLDPASSQKMLISLKSQLLSNARTGFRMNPSNYKEFSEIKDFTVEQRIKIKDIGSFNRFADAIQEVVTVAVKALLVYGIISTTESTTSDQKPPQPPPEGMYA